MNGKRPYMDYCQYWVACRLVHECCNYDNGNCCCARCTECGGYSLPKSNRGEYCPDCAGRMKRTKVNEKKAAERKARTRRLIERGAILESLLDQPEQYDNEQITAGIRAAVQTPLTGTAGIGQRNGAGHGQTAWTMRLRSGDTMKR